jgi:predicted nucleic acid-binding protein
VTCKWNWGGCDNEIAHEIAYVQQWLIKALESLSRAKIMAHSAGLSIYDTNLSDEMAAALITQEIGLDFDDTLQDYVAKKLGSDRHLEIGHTQN